MSVSSTQRPQDKRGTPKLMTSMAFIVSVVVHAVVFLFIGSVVVFEGKIPQNLFESAGGSLVDDGSGEEMELPPLLEEEMEPEMIESPMEELEMTTEIEMDQVMNTSDLITTSVMTPTMVTHTITNSLGTADVGAMVQPSFKAGSGKKSGGRRAAGPGGVRTANIFGREVTAGKLGAILDISQSTRKTIDAAVMEIENGFPDAVLVLAPGCGMKQEQKGEVIAGKKFEQGLDGEFGIPKGEQRYNKYNNSRFLPGLIKKNKRFEELWKDAKREERGFVIHIPAPEDKNYKDALIFGTQVGFTFLQEQGCDVIYWMADFKDDIDEKTARGLVKQLKRSGVKVIQHDFDGGNELSKGKGWKIKSLFYQETGGDLIVGEGKGKK